MIKLPLELECDYYDRKTFENCPNKGTAYVYVREISEIVDRSFLKVHSDIIPNIEGWVVKEKIWYDSDNELECFCPKHKDGK